MHVCRYLLVYRLKVKRVNIYTKNHLRYICINDRLKHLIFWNGGSTRQLCLLCSCEDTIGELPPRTRLSPRYIL
jgi:hypothetical protein